MGIAPLLLWITEVIINFQGLNIKGIKLMLFYNRGGISIKVIMELTVRLI